MKHKTFLISIDTEGDNLWDYKPGDKITTKNTDYLLRFQNLCDRYGFKPTYLTNYEMANDPHFVETFKPVAEGNRCEIGMHLHAWNSPPDYTLTPRDDGLYGSAYLIEYPLDIMEQKIACMTDLITDRFGQKPITHRAGRWATDQNYFNLLNKFGYLADCSVTPGISWEDCPGFTKDSKGTDYTDFNRKPYTINGTDILEIPVTVRQNHRFRKPAKKRLKSYLGNAYRAWRGTGKIWLRPNGNNLENMLWLADDTYRSNNKYLMFMLHSSEFMPGGSPTFDTPQKIEKLFEDLEILFKHISEKYDGATIGEYAKSLKEENR